MNLGCGHKIWPQEDGWINIDFANNWSKKKPDIECDLKQLPFPDNYADEVYAIHVIEHFYFYEVATYLREWYRVLKPQGKIVIECPDLKKILRFFYDDPIDLRLTLFALYGDPRYKNKDMVHRWCYNFSILKDLLESCKFCNVVETVPIHHVPKRDLRAEANK